MKKDLISVILPIYNVSDYLDRCMESVINQTYRNIEIIIVDDGSTDGSALKCDEYKKKDDRIIVFHKENGGLSDARNYGIQRASGNFITCIDSDDFVDLDYIEYLYALLMKYNTKMSICQHRVLFDNGKIKEKGTYAKMARGSLVRYMAEHQIENPEEIKQFDELGYKYKEEYSNSTKYCYLIR